MKKKIDIRSLSEEKLLEFCFRYKLPKFRAKQITEWLWKKRVVSFDEMTSLSINTRNILSNSFCINPVTIHKAQRSIDRTIKYS